MAYLKDGDLKEIARIILAGGKKTFIDNLAINKVTHSGKPAECFICHKPAGKKDGVWMLLGNTGIPAFGDRYDMYSCAERAKLWLEYILDEYLRILGPKMVAGGILSEDDLRDGLFPSENESTRKFFANCKRRLRQLG